MSLPGSIYRKRQANVASSASWPPCLSTKLDLSKELRDISPRSSSTHTKQDGFSSQRFKSALSQRLTSQNELKVCFLWFFFPRKSKVRCFLEHTGVIFQALAAVWQLRLLSALLRVAPKHPAHLIDRLSRQSVGIFFLTHASLILSWQNKGGTHKLI